MHLGLTPAGGLVVELQREGEGSGQSFAFLLFLRFGRQGGRIKCSLWDRRQ